MKPVYNETSRNLIFFSVGGRFCFIQVTEFWQISLLQFLQNHHQLQADIFNPLNSVLNSIRHLLALLGAHHILHVSRIRVKQVWCIFLQLSSNPLMMKEDVSNYRPGLAFRASGVRGFQNFQTICTWSSWGVSLKHRLLLRLGAIPGGYFCYSLSRIQGLSAAGRFKPVTHNAL